MDGQFDLGTGRMSAPDPEFRANSLRSFAHTQESPVFITFRSQHSRVDPAAIISNDNAQMPGGVFELDLNIHRTRMPEGIDQCFASDTVDFIADSFTQQAEAPCRKKRDRGLSD